MTKAKDTEKAAAKRGRGRPPVEDGLTGKIALRALPEDVEQLGATAKAIGFKEPDVARVAIRLGMTLLDLDSTLFMVGATGAKSRRTALRLRLKEQD